MTTDDTPDWNGLADRLEALSEELLAAAGHVEDVADDHLLQLQSVTLKHYSMNLRMLAG